MVQCLDATHPAPAACASGPRGRIRRRTHQTVSVAVAPTMQSDPLRVYDSDWRLVPLRLQMSRSMRVQRPLIVPSEWMAWQRLVRNGHRHGT